MLCKRAIEEYAKAREKEVLTGGSKTAFYKYASSRRKTNLSVASLKDSTGKLGVSELDKANILSSTFVSTFTQDDSKNRTFPRRPNLPEGACISTVSFVPAVVFDVLCSLSLKYSCGPDGIPPAFYKLLAIELAKPLSIIFEVSFQSGSVPDIWLTAIVLPIFKKGSVSDPNNYRPISLTCVACKIMETVIAKSLLFFLRSFCLINKNQHGFLDRHSTSTQLLECVNDWTLALDNKQLIDCVYVDYAKAFDSVSHPKLAQKLMGYGISGSVLNWIKCFLLNRTFCVDVNGSRSNTLPVTSGVVQGSVLGPLLFLLYINDVMDDLPKGTCAKLFADDLKLYTVHGLGKSNQLQNSLNILEVWSAKWQLSIASHKCLALYFGSGNPSDVYSLNGEEIEAVSSCRDLGVTMSPDMTFSTHCNSVYSKAMRDVNMLFRCFLSDDKSFLLQGYKTFVRPSLEYCTLIYDPLYLKDVDKIENVQRYFTRRLYLRCGLCVDEPYLRRIEVLNLESLEERRLKADLTMVYQIIHHLIDLNFNEFFTYAPDVGTRSHGHKLFVNICRLNIRKHFFSNRIVQVWNKLPIPADQPSPLEIPPMCSPTNAILRFKRYLNTIDFSTLVEFKFNRLM